MTQPIPKWIQIRYALLWKKFKEKEFSFDQAEKAMEDNKGFKVFLSDLRKAGWIEIRLDSKDSRKRKYKLFNPIQIFEKMYSEVRL